MTKRSHKPKPHKVDKVRFAHDGQQLPPGVYERWKDGKPYYVANVSISGRGCIYLGARACIESAAILVRDAKNGKINKTRNRSRMVDPDSLDAMERTHYSTHLRVVNEWRGVILALSELPTIEAFDGMLNDVPAYVRRSAFALRIDDDPLWPILRRICSVCGTSEVSLQTLAILYGVTRERIRQIEARAMAIAKPYFAEWSDFGADDRESPMAIIEGGVW